MIRLDKMISNLGLGSRKDVKKMIRQKMVTVNDELVTNDDIKVDELNDCVKLNNQIINYQEFVYIMLHKPVSYVSANEDPNDPVVFELINDHTKGLFCVGRLDKDTEGLLLITNDGKLAHQLLSPKNEVYKKYLVHTEKKLDDEAIELLESGTIMLDEDRVQPARVECISDNCYYLSISEGKYHQVKRMISACQNEVVYLKRISMGPLVLDPSLKLGDYRYLSEEELHALKNL